MRWYGLMLVGLFVLLAACGIAPTDEPEAAAEADTEPTADQAAVPAGFPLTIENCDYTVTFDAPPERVVVNDVNILELFLALDLEEHLVGYSSVRDDKEIAPEYQAQLDGIPLLAERYPSIEVLAGANPDLYLAGWNYGMTEDSGLTPETLAPLGINTYAITESCIRVMEREQVSLEDTFTDLRNLGKIFAVEDRAEALIAQYRAELAEITETVGPVDEPLRVFVYDSGEDTPLTAARFATPNAMIEAAGGTNIFNDVDSSWTQVNWEDVVDRNPEHIVIIDYGQPDAQGKINFLKGQPELADVAAIQNDNFVVLTYAEATPGPRNVARTRTLAEAFYPEKFE
jgi:iron complex transport system substrate-binding protein